MTTKIKKLRPPIKSHGGKFYLTDFIISHFPKNYEELNYCEPFCSGASVFLNKAPSPEETLCDVDRGIISIFKALRDEPKEFISRIKRIRYTENTFKRALRLSSTNIKDYIDKAVNEYVLRRMSRGGMKKSFAWSDRIRGGQPGDVNAWQTMYKQLPLMANRVKDVTILHVCFKQVVKIWDEEKMLIYLDPPYLPSTRSDGSASIYEHEMSVDDHVAMLNFVKNARGKVLISGYVSPLYNRHLMNWKCSKKDMPNHSSQTKKKDRRIEVLWRNY